MAIGKAGAISAALLAAQILALQDSDLRKRLGEYRERKAGRSHQSLGRTFPKQLLTKTIAACELEPQLMAPQPQPVP